MLVSRTDEAGQAGEEQSPPVLLKSFSAFTPYMSLLEREGNHPSFPNSLKGKSSKKTEEIAFLQREKGQGKENQRH